MSLENVSALLPETIQDIVSVIGFPATEKLVKHLGGVTLWLSQQERSNCYLKLREVLGKEDAQKLHKYLAYGDNLYIPRCDVALRALRNLRFKAEFDELTQHQGYSKPKAMIALCPKYGFSDRRGWDILKECVHLEQDMQILLF